MDLPGREKKNRFYWWTGARWGIGSGRSCGKQGGGGDRIEAENVGKERNRIEEHLRGSMETSEVKTS